MRKKKSKKLEFNEKKKICKINASENWVSVKQVEVSPDDEESLTEY